MQAVYHSVPVEAVLDRFHRMTEYSERSYRGQFASGRRVPFCVKYLESDLWIGVDADSYERRMERDALLWLMQLRHDMDVYISRDPEFRTSLLARSVLADAPETAKWMSDVSQKTGIGPMSAVAGAFAQSVGIRIKKKYGCREVIVENGGDIYADVSEDMNVSVFAGKSPLSQRVGVCIPKGEFPLGICTSSGTVGPSLSFGKADAAMVICRDAALADSYATLLANRITVKDDVQPVLDSVSGNSDILSAIAIKDDRMAMCGKYELRLFK